jgi:hypothetical protein
MKARVVATHDTGAAAEARVVATYDTDAAGVSLRIPERRAIKAPVIATHDTDAAAKAREQVIAAHDAVPR